MKKILIILIFLSLFAMMLIGCSKNNASEPTSTDPVVVDITPEAVEKSKPPATTEEEIENYVNVELPIFWYLEEIPILAFQDAIGMGYESEAQVYTALTRQVIPGYKDFLDYLNEVKLQYTPELIEIHHNFIEAANKQYEALKVIQKAMEAGDQNYIEQGDPLIAEAAEGFNKWQLDINALAEKYSIEIINPYEEDTQYAENGEFVDPILEEFLKDLLEGNESGGEGSPGPMNQP